MTVVDPSSQQACMTVLTSAATAAHESRVRGFDLLNLNASSMWTIFMTSPSQNAALGARMVQESGSGKSRDLINVREVADRSQG